MAGTIFFRERTRVGEGKKTPRFIPVAVAGLDLTIFAKHLRKQELEQIAREVGAKLVQLKATGKKGEEVVVK